MRIWLRLGCLAAASGYLVGVAQAEPLRIFYFVWVGYGPLFVAQEKGFFAREGVEVELINNEDHTAAFADCSPARSMRWRAPPGCAGPFPSRMKSLWCACW